MVPATVPTSPPGPAPPLPCSQGSPPGTTCPASQPLWVTEGGHVLGEGSARRLLAPPPVLPLGTPRQPSEAATPASPRPQQTQRGHGFPAASGATLRRMAEPAGLSLWLQS